MNKIQVNLNDNKFETETNTSLESFLKTQNENLSAGVAVAVNGQVVPASLWSKQSLQENDNILLIRAVRGG